MSKPTQLPDRLSGMALMVLAIFTFTIMEVMVKFASQTIDTIQILWFRNAGQLILVGIIIAPRARTVIRSKYPKLQIMRAFFMLSATACFFVGYLRNSLVETNAMAQVAPIFITIGAAMVLGEKIGRHRKASVVLGLIGAMIVLRPGTGGFSPWLLFPMLGAAFYSAYALATRFVGRDENIWTSLIWTGFVATAILTAIVPFTWRTPTGYELALLIGIGICGTSAQLFLTRAFAQSEASALAPLSYVSLIFSATWGIIFFGHYPDSPVYLGALVIMLAGIYVWHRERQGNA